MRGPHVVVVGAGIVGASIAWHLVDAGALVTLTDAEGAGGVATPNSFAWINASWGNPEPYFRLRVRAMAEWRRLQAAVPTLPLRWCGALLWDLPPDALERFADEHSSWGYGIRRVDRDEAARIEPALADPPDLALHVAEEGAVEPAAAAKILANEAERRGARLAMGMPVKNLLAAGGRVRGVQTATETITADEVVLAAGLGTPVLAATAGVAVPLDGPAGLLVHSRPYPPLLNGLVLAPELHMRQTADSRIVAGTDVGGGDPGLDAKAAADRLFAAVRRSLGADDLQFGFHTVGYRPTPTDGIPIMGRTESVAGLYVAVMHSGITLCAAVGAMAAQGIVNDSREPLLEPYRPDRFTQGT